MLDVLDAIAAINQHIARGPLTDGLVFDAGQPRPGDWRLWEELRQRMAVARSELIDLVVVGERSWWAAVGAT